MTVDLFCNLFIYASGGRGDDQGDSPGPAPLGKGMRAKLLQLCPTLCSPMDRSPPGSSVHGILQARILERAAVASSRGSS